MPTDWGMPADAEDVIIAWLAPLGVVSAERPAGDVLPYRLVTRVAGSDNRITDSAVVSVHTFAATITAAATEARATHHRMLSLGPQDDVVMPDSTIVRVECVDTHQGPLWVDYEDDTIKRYVARYEINLRFVAA